MIDDLPYDGIEDPKQLAADSIARRTAGSKLTVEVRRKLNGSSNTGWSDIRARWSTPRCVHNFNASTRVESECIGQVEQPDIPTNKVSAFPTCR